MGVCLCSVRDRRAVTVTPRRGAHVTLPSWWPLETKLSSSSDKRERTVRAHPWYARLDQSSSNNSPFHAARPSRIAKHTTTSPAKGSAHHQPKTAFAPTPTSVAALSTAHSSVSAASAFTSTADP